MLLVNNPGSWSYVYPPLRHAEWHGCTPTDLIFPFFLFIVGVALTLSFARRRAAGASVRQLLGKVVVRAIVIIAVGLALNGFPRYDLATIRIPGVLQRIGLVYLVAASAWVLLPPPAVGGLVALLLLGYWALMTLVPVPGYGPGVLEPVGNLAQYLDARLLVGHMWRPEWDPEGLLSTLPAIATCLIGALAGHWIQRRLPEQPVSGRLVLAGVLLGGAGWIWGWWFPVNKSLWTSSYVLFTGGAALAGLALCLWLIDERGFERWALPGYIFGANPLTVFVASGLLARVLGLIRVGDGAAAMPLQRWLYQRLFAGWAGPLNGSLAYALAFVLLWLGLILPLYRRGWRIRV